MPDGNWAKEMSGRSADAGTAVSLAVRRSASGRRREESDGAVFAPGVRPAVPPLGVAFGDTPLLVPLLMSGAGCGIDAGGVGAGVSPVAGAAWTDLCCGASGWAMEPRKGASSSGREWLDGTVGLTPVRFCAMGGTAWPGALATAVSEWLEMAVSAVTPANPSGPPAFDSDGKAYPDRAEREETVESRAPSAPWSTIGVGRRAACPASPTGNLGADGCCRAEKNPTVDSDEACEAGEEARTGRSPPPSCPRFATGACGKAACPECS